MEKIKYNLIMFLLINLIKNNFKENKLDFFNFLVEQ